MTVKTENVCFVISPIGEEASPERSKADQLLKFIIQPVLIEQGYRVERADTIDEPGTITAQIIEYLVEAPIVVADMTDSNPNVFYELAVRHAAKQPVVHMMSKGQRIPFDVAPERAIYYSLDLQGADVAKAQLTKFVSSIKRGDHEPVSPLTNAVDRIALRRSSIPQDRRDSVMLEMLQDIQVRFINLEAEEATIIRSRRLVSDEILTLWDSVWVIDSMAKRLENNDLVEAVIELKKALLRFVDDLMNKRMLSRGAFSKFRHPSRSQIWRDFLTMESGDDLLDQEGNL